MGCSGSKEEARRSRSPRGSWVKHHPATPTSAERRLVKGLQDLKRQMDEENYGKDAFSFTKIILKLGTIEEVLRRVKAVFKSVDHGNKGHVTMDELKEGLHKARVDLGGEWEDTNIDECLQHLQGRAEDTDKVGLREFVVMLAVGRVCRPLKRRSTVFVPLQEQPLDEGQAVAGRGASELSKKTIDENEVRRPSIVLETQYTVETTAAAAAAAAAEFEAEEAAAASAAGEHDALGGDSITTTAASSTADGTAGTDDAAGNVPVQRQSSAASSETASAAEVDVEERAAVAAAAAAAASQSSSGGAAPYASAGPGGLPRGTSWKTLKWAQIPSLKSIDASMRGISKGFSRSSGVGKSGSGLEGGGAGVVGSSSEVDVSMSVKYVLDLFIAAYFQFDPVGQGFISKKTVEKTLRQGEREPGASGLLDQKRWSEAAWEGDRLSFQEFIFAFAQWLGLLEDDEDYGKDDTNRYKHSSPSAAPARKTPAATVGGSQA